MKAATLRHKPSIHRRPAMRKLLLLPLSTVIIWSPSIANAQHRKSSEEAVLRSYTQQLLDAVGSGSKPIWVKLLSPDFLGMDEEGKVRGKDEIIGELQPLPPGLAGQLKVDQFKVVFHGDVAIAAHEDQEQLSYYGQMVHSRYRNVDTWQRGAGGWHLIAQHTTAVLKDPPAMAMQKAEGCEYGGRYRLADGIEATIRCSPTGLVASRAGRPDTSYSMEVPDVFFAPGHPRTRRIFQHSADGRVSGFVDRREGEDIHWTKIAGS